ncbi:hydrolase or metal-binding protein [Thiomicrorhabdus xiamenensis]|uniref:Hydrolase or metal-binding protein n=1 Tax=Thiomicrorhabdus xiamenensis TaxID=2739063 RepID=A0A7D4NPF4_9GAMM|nr:hydrolase or metal-binding protein [Thiomicrorhabdus xiamenensis]QKI89633.1 hydrolase or metal-binding protein [Thiomicrorhabdus xiamenensis]
MLKGFALTPPTIGRISIGQIIEKNGKRLPKKDDQFTITSQIQTSEGWIKHPLDKALRSQSANGKLREIPIQVLFNQPDLNLRAEYCLFDRQTARPICTGNGETCLRHTPNGFESLSCPSPEHCEFASAGCKPYGRLNVVITPEPNHDKDPIGSFVFRTSGFNSIRTLASRLSYFQALSGNRLACLPLALKIRGKSTRQSYGQPIYYVDLTLRDGTDLESTLEQAINLEQKRLEMGFDQSALDEAAKRGFGNGYFEDDEDTIESVIEEFYPEAGINAQSVSTSSANSLTDRMDQQIQQLNRH